MHCVLCHYQVWSYDIKNSNQWTDLRFHKMLAYISTQMWVANYTSRPFSKHIQKGIWFYLKDWKEILTSASPYTTFNVDKNMKNMANNNIFNFFDTFAIHRMFKLNKPTNEDVMIKIMQHTLVLVAVWTAPIQSDIHILKKKKNRTELMFSSLVIDTGC